MSDDQTIGSYRIRGALRQDSFSTLYRGGVDDHDASDGERAVAIQVCGVEDDRLRERFREAAGAAARLHHAHIATVEEVGEQDGLPFLVQELLPGDDLRSTLARHAAPDAATRLGWLVQIARALAYAHQQGVAHGALQPSCVHFGEDGTVKLSGFATARLERARDALRDGGGTPRATLAYLAPEQVRGGAPTPATDLYAFGAVAFEMLTGERPFRSSSLSGLVYKVLYKIPAPVLGLWSGCPESLSDLIARCLQKKAARRWPDAETLLSELESLTDEVTAGRWPALAASLPSPSELGDGSEVGANELEETLRQIDAWQSAAEQGDTGATLQLRASEAEASTAQPVARAAPGAMARWAALAGAVLLVALVGLGTWLSRSSEPPPVAPPPPPIAVTPPPPPPPPPVDGELVVRAAPWAEVVAIVDDLGNLLPLPADPTTPLRLRLPAGRYALYLRHPRAREMVRCESEVRPDVLALCDAEALESNAVDYFKEAGWWR